MTTTLGDKMKALMRERGVSLRKLAQVVKYDVGYLSKISNDKRTPSLETAAAIDAALDADGELLALAEERVRRRQFLGASVTMSAAAIVPAVPGSVGRRIGLSQIEDLRLRIARLRRLDDHLGGADTYRLYATELQAVSALVDDGSYTEATGRMLLSIVAEAGHQTGWAAFDAGWHIEARRLFRSSLTAATDAGDVALMGNRYGATTCAPSAPSSRRGKLSTAAITSLPPTGRYGSTVPSSRS